MENDHNLKAFGLAPERFINMETMPLDLGEYIHPHGISKVIATSYETGRDPISKNIATRFPEQV